jgi:hypothetical protein
MMIIRNTDIEGRYNVGHYTPEGDFEVLARYIGERPSCYFDFDEAVSIAGRINGSGAAPHVVPTE